MVLRMTRRGTWTRCIALVWATLQLLSPGVSAIADGRLALEAAGSPQVHVEATGSATCPEVHSPDCGVCRYLTTGGVLPSASGLVPIETRHSGALAFRIVRLNSAVEVLPHGRAPPVL
jgi:hypothetical protein